MTVKLDVTPSNHLPISVARQAQIIEAINAKLAINPRQGFCFMGSPGKGKTYLMRAIQRCVPKISEPYVEPQVIKMTTLAEWQEANVARVRGEAVSWDLMRTSAKHIRDTAEHNRRQGWNPAPKYSSLHFFIDEFDSQPTVSEFSSSMLQTFINACYENATRVCDGNESDFVS